VTSPAVHSSPSCRVHWVACRQALCARCHLQCCWRWWWWWW